MVVGVIFLDMVMAATGRTGLVSPDCYAGTLADCDGGAATREHYISESILKRFGARLQIVGTPWARAEKRVGTGALTARVLCRRHNEALSSLDSEALRFFDLLDDVGQQNIVGTHTFDGRLIERWSLKVLAGLVASGNALRTDGIKTGDPISDYVIVAARNHLLAYLFGFEPIPESIGFHVMVAPPGSRSELLNVSINSIPVGQDGERLIHGITFQMHGLFFTTALLPLDGEGVWHRPARLRLMNYAEIVFDWGQSSSTLMVELGDSSLLANSDPQE